MASEQPDAAAAAPRRAGRCWVIISELCEDWVEEGPSECAQRITNYLETFGRLASPPTLLAGGEQAKAAFNTEASAQEAVQALNGKVFNLAIESVEEAPVEEDNLKKRIAGLLQGAQTHGVFELPEESPPGGEPARADGEEAERHRRRRRRHRHGRAHGSGDEQDPELQGEGDDAGSGADPASKRRRKDRDDGGERRIAVVHIDEIEMPERPDVEPTEADREVWVDPMPDEDELPEWLLTFGEAEEVYRIPEAEASTGGQRGYIVFKDHSAARQCVEDGTASWSESERALASHTPQRQGEGGRTAYPDSLVARILGERSDNIRDLRRQSGARRVAVRGKGLGDDSASDRIHFVIEGTDDTVMASKAELGILLACVHREVKARIADPSNTANRAPEVFEADADRHRGDRRRRRETAEGAEGGGGEVGGSGALKPVAKGTIDLNRGPWKAPGAPGTSSPGPPAGPAAGPPQHWPAPGPPPPGYPVAPPHWGWGWPPPWGYAPGAPPPGAPPPGAPPPGAPPPQGSGGGETKCKRGAPPPPGDAPPGCFQPCQGWGAPPLPGSAWSQPPGSAWTAPSVPSQVSPGPPPPGAPPAAPSQAAAPPAEEGGAEGERDRHRRHHRRHKHSHGPGSGDEEGASARGDRENGDRHRRHHRSHHPEDHGDRRHHREEEHGDRRHHRDEEHVDRRRQVDAEHGDRRHSRQRRDEEHPLAEHRSRRREEEHDHHRGRHEHERRGDPEPRRSRDGPRDVDRARERDGERSRDLPRPSAATERERPEDKGVWSFQGWG